MGKLHQVGIIGMGVMGKNLALNMASKGFSVAVYDYWQDRTDDLMRQKGEMNILGACSAEEFINMMDTPRKILLMVKAGETVDEVISSLKPYLAQGDILIDGGNSFFRDTIRRSMELGKEGIRFIGAGISGGEEGALKGPAIMPGGNRTAYEQVENILNSIAAKVDGEPCCAYIGTDGAGHFVKMVHNGIEYGDMQLICEAYHVLKTLGGLNAHELHTVFAQWNKGELSSYLIEITADIFTKFDEDTGLPLVDIILDRAGQKGTGMWTSKLALELGTPVPSITEAVFSRYISSLKEERTVAGKILEGPDGVQELGCNMSDLIEDVRKALYASKICMYAQGFMLMKAASLKFGWNLNPGSIASIFRGGCIIRAQFLDRIREAFDKDGDLNNLLIAPYFSDILTRYQTSWRKVISAAVVKGIPVPAFSSALSYFDSYRCDRLPANLLQAQRDYFGAHTVERIDKEGIFHFEWH